MKTVYAAEMPDAWVARAWRAHQFEGRVLLHEGRFWRVVRIRASWRTYAFDIVELIIVNARVRKSIDDCSPAEWDAASRAVR